MNPFAGGATFKASAPVAGAKFNYTATPPTLPKGPGSTLWIVGVGGVVILGGLVAAVVLSSPAEAPGAREYHRRRLRRA